MVKLYTIDWDYIYTSISDFELEKLYTYEELLPKLVEILNSDNIHLDSLRIEYVGHRENIKEVKKNLEEIK